MTTYTLTTEETDFTLDVPSSEFSLDALAYEFTIDSVGIPGPPGPQGPAGSSQLESFTASASISGHAPVLLSGGQAAVADATVLAHLGRVIGITTGAANTGSPVAVFMHGSLTEPSWSWTPDAPVFLGAGALTQTPPTLGGGFVFSQRLGFALSPTVVFMDIEAPILL